MTKKKAKPKKETCPHCGNERPLNDARVYECPKCGAQGFDCCVPGRNTLCWGCSEPEED